MARTAEQGGELVNGTSDSTDGRGAAPATAADDMLHVAVVHGPGRVHFVAAARTRGAMMARLGEYVAAQAAVQLYGEDARTVLGLMAAGSAEAGVRHYFQRVGRRWDVEWLNEVLVAGGTVLAADV